VATIMPSETGRQRLTESAAETEAAGERLGAQLVRGDMLLLVGEMGAGKTTLVRGIARGMGLDADVMSPTFQLVRLYRGRLPLAHVDVYRLAGTGEIAELGLDELLDEGVVVVEWGDRLTWPGASRIRIEEPTRTSRRLLLEEAPERWSW
jgi:tRNA threonylcarbamoyladenosine biosynthesis protein TsaE